VIESQKADPHEFGMRQQSESSLWKQGQESIFCAGLQLTTADLINHIVL
jgi:hypothetical protein